MTSPGSCSVLHGGSKSGNLALELGCHRGTGSWGQVLYRDIRHANPMKSFTCTAKLSSSAPQVPEVCSKGTPSRKSLKQARHQGVYCWGIAVAQDDNPCLCPRDSPKEKLLNNEAVGVSQHPLGAQRLVPCPGSSLQEMLDAPAGDVYYVDGAGLGGTIKRALGVTGLSLRTKLFTSMFWSLAQVP